jgi:uncharacterized protein with PIN domain
MAPRFIADVNVGRLAKWLRVIGYDTLFVPGVDDTELLRIAMEEGRTVVTRDRYIMERRVVTTGRVKAVLVHSDDFREQMQQVTETLGLGFQSGFSLCIECNTSLEETSKESVRERVPPFVFSTQERFLVCLACRKLYWRGTHWRNMKAELGGFKKDA